ncbi:MAG: hypothetical protein ACUVRD_08510 [Bacteroidia bacterium]
MFIRGLLMGILWAQVSYQERLISASNIRMTLSNLGNIGNSFKGSYRTLGWPSCEYPAGSRIEHVFEGGLWVGGWVQGTPIVSTGAIDDPTGYTTGKAGFEFSADVGAPFTERSSLIDQKTYQTNAISHQDFVADFTDRYTIVPGTSIPIQNLENGPLGVDVHFESYNWNYTFANFFVILNFTLYNRSPNRWDTLYVGYWVDPVVRNVNLTPAGSGGTNFYNKGGNGYLDTLFLAYEFDAAGDVGFTDTYLGLKFLGSEYKGSFYHPRLRNDFFCNFQSWTFRDFAGPYRSPANDAEKYLKMSQSLTKRPDWNTTVTAQLRAPGNRSILVSVGPFLQVQPGDSLHVTFAIVLARKKDDGRPNVDDTPTQKTELISHAQWAQAAYNGEDANFNGILDPGEDLDGNGKLTRFLLPSPPNVPKTRYELLPGKIRIYWDDRAENSIDPITRRKDFEGYRIYKTQIGFEKQATVDILSNLQLTAQFDKENNGIGYDNGFRSIRLPTPMRFEGDPTPYVYMYEISNAASGWQYGISVTGFDEGEPPLNLPSLESSLEAGLQRVFTGTPPNKGFQNGDPYVYPNPYIEKAAWEGISQAQEDKRIQFANLPPHCEVRIYNAAGEMVYSFEHHQDAGVQDSRWFATYSDPEKVKSSGGEHAWNLLSKNGQILARGLYVFAVKDLETGQVRTGKFVLIR